MPTVSEPKPQEELEQPIPPEPELFAAEIAMEERSHNFAPVLLALALGGLIGGLIFYFVKTTHEVLTTEQAQATVSDILRTKGPAIVHFSTGTVEPENGQQDPLYKMLSKAGIVTSKTKERTLLAVELTAPGENILSSIDGVKKTTAAKGETDFAVPLAQRQVVAIDKVTMLQPRLARVDYSWQWMPNRLGREFDATSQLVQSFPTWDRAILIKSYAVDFYSAAATKSSIVLMKTTDGVWQPYTE
jgi:hypothetical protein